MNDHEKSKSQLIEELNVLRTEVTQLKVSGEWFRQSSEDEFDRLTRLLKNIVDSMPSVLVGVDSRLRVIQWNREAEKITGVSESAALGRLLVDVFPSMAGHLDKIQTAIEEGVLQKEPKIIELQDGEPHFMDVTIYPLLNSGIGGAVIRIDDVTQRVRFEEMLIHSEKMLSVGSLASGMAHEINNPLAGILQNMQVIQNRINPDLPRNRSAAEACGTSMETVARYIADRGLNLMIDSVMESGKRVSRIVNNILNFSRRSEMNFASHKLEELMERTLELAYNDYDLKKQYDFRKIHIDREYQNGIPGIFCESTEIQQVILNLLKNGAEAMVAHQQDASSPPKFILRLYVTADDSDMACIEIEDNGPGIDQEIRERIFEPFFTTKAPGGGTGLGLSVAHYIVNENHNGSMSVESSPGRGACFKICLPIVRSVG